MVSSALRQAQIQAEWATEHGRVLAHGGDGEIRKLTLFAPEIARQATAGQFVQIHPRPLSQTATEAPSAQAAPLAQVAPLAQAALAGGLDRCAAWVLATVVSRPGPDRAVLDTGSKSLTTDARPRGVCRTSGCGLLPDHGLTIARVSEEHGVVEGDGVERLRIGDKVRVVPNHICPVVNLFDEVVAVRGGVVEMVLPVAARGRLQ